MHLVEQRTGRSGGAAVSRTPQVLRHREWLHIMATLNKSQPCFSEAGSAEVSDFLYRLSSYFPHFHLFQIWKQGK